jgi:type II secretory pathway component GspD/PulD (secretin)
MMPTASPQPSAPVLASASPGTSVPRLAAAVLLFTLIGACGGPDSMRREREERGELSEDMLRELLEEGTIRPVASMGDPYAGPEPELEMRRPAVRPGPPSPVASPSASATRSAGPGDDAVGVVLEVEAQAVGQVVGQPDGGAPGHGIADGGEGLADGGEGLADGGEGLADGGEGLTDGGEGQGDGLGEARAGVGGSLDVRPAVHPAGAVPPPVALLSLPPGQPFFNPWAEFGSRIAYDGATGLVTKPYPLRLKMGKKVFELAQEYGDFEFHDPAQGPQGPGELDLVLMESFDVEAITPDLRGPLHVTGSPIAIADWLVARAQPEVLREFEYFLNTFISSPPQIEIEAKIVEVVTRDSFDMGVSDFLATLPEKALFNTIGFNLPNRSASELLLNVGTIHDGTQFSALIELLSTFENVSIISRPRTAVREGGRARVEAIERIPFLQVASVTATGGFNTALTYLEVGVRLFVTPRLIGNKVALEIDVEASQQTGDAVTVASSDGEIITTPILSTRQARTLVYLRPGEAVILGGLITERAVDQERKVPFFGDLPLVGALFRSTFQVKAKAQVLFFIRPRVMQGADLNYEF